MPERGIGTGYVREVPTTSADGEETWLDTYTESLASVLPGWSRTALVAATGFAAGIVGKVMQLGWGDDSVGWTLGAMCAAAAVEAAHHRRKGSFPGFQADVLALWVTFATSYLLVHGGFSRGVVDAVAVFWAGCAGVGGAIVASRRGGARHRAEREDAEC
jgi:hypothetical protein